MRRPPPGLLSLLLLGSLWAGCSRAEKSHTAPGNESHAGLAGTVGVTAGGAGGADAGTGAKSAGRGGQATTSPGGSGGTGTAQAGAESAGEAQGGAEQGGADQAGAGSGNAGKGGARVALESPWGVAPSASSSRSVDAWAKGVAAAGVGWIRGFDTSQIAKTLGAANDNGLELSGIFLFSDPGPTQTFPINSLPEFADYVTNILADTEGRVRLWEVWNEPPNFTANTDPAAYAAVVNTAYDAVKAANPAVQVGIAAQSNHVNWLAQTIDAGAAGHFDYVTVHPYETLALVADGWEAEYMRIVPTLRKMLADKDPSRVDVPVIFTEVGEPVTGDITPEHQADTLVKAYVMGIAQGATRVHWFEPLDGDSGPFGLFEPDGTERPSYVALKELTRELGGKPAYVGWVLLNDSSYAFVFDATDATVLVTWAPPEQTEQVSFGTPVTLIRPRTGERLELGSFDLDSSPVLVRGVPDALRTEALGNRDKPFPWGGDFSAATEVSFTAPSTVRGLHPVGKPPERTFDGVIALDASSRAAQSFTVDPNFSSYVTTRLEITAVLRNNGTDAAGFNLKYESTSGWKSTGEWYTVPGDDQWHTQTWTLDDPQFVGKWGYEFSFDSDSLDHSGYSIRSVSVTKP